VRVKVVRVDMESTKIDFVLESVEGKETGASAGGVNIGAWGAPPPGKLAKTGKSAEVHKATAGKGGKTAKGVKKGSKHHG